MTAILALAEGCVSPHRNREVWLAFARSSDDRWRVPVGSFDIRTSWAGTVCCLPFMRLRWTDDALLHRSQDLGQVTITELRVVRRFVGWRFRVVWLRGNSDDEPIVAQPARPF